MTRDHGRHAGLVRGGKRAIAQPGNRVHAHWRARLAEHLGTFRCELTNAFAARLMDDAGAGEEELRRFLVRASQLEHRAVEFGIDLLGIAGVGFRYRLRGPHELELAKAMLLDGGACAAGLDVVDGAADRVGRSGAQAFECVLDLAGGRREAVLLGRCPRSSLAPAAVEALAGLQDSGDPWLSVGPWGLELTVEAAPADWAGERGSTLVGVFGKDLADIGHVRVGLQDVERDVACERTG